MTSTSPPPIDTAVDSDAERLPPFPASDVQRYRAARLWGELTLAEQFHLVARQYPDRNAVVAAGGRLTYRQIDEESDRIAAGLVDLGLRPGDPVLFQVGNQLHSIVAWYAVLEAGLIPIATLCESAPS